MKLHYTQQAHGRVPPKVRIVICLDASPFCKASATHGDMYVNLQDRTQCAGGLSFWSTWFAFDGSDNADLLHLGGKLGKLSL